MACIFMLVLITLTLTLEMFERLVLLVEYLFIHPSNGHGNIKFNLSSTE